MSLPPPCCLRPAVESPGGRGWPAAHTAHQQPAVHAAEVGVFTHQKRNPCEHMNGAVGRGNNCVPHAGLLTYCGATRTHRHVTCTLPPLFTCPSRGMPLTSSMCSLLLLHAAPSSAATPASLPVLPATASSCRLPALTVRASAMDVRLLLPSWLLLRLRRWRHRVFFRASAKASPPASVICVTGG